MTGDPSIVIAGRKLTVDEAAEKICLYQRQTKNTVDKYDLPGPGDPSKLTIEEVVRTRIVKSRISNLAAAWFVETAEKVGWPPPQADLRDADPAVRGGLYDDLNACYQYFWDKRQPGVGIGKISKVLHIKRPAAYPILDSRVTAFYSDAAKRAAANYPALGHKKLFWAAIRADLIANTESGALEMLRERLKSTGLEPYIRLTDLRLMDILTWG
jgi:hypothetical protein